LVVILLSACGNGAVVVQLVEEVPVVAEEHEAPPSLDETEAEPPSTYEQAYSYPFVIPEVDHPYAGEMSELINAYCTIFNFPQFDSLDELDVTLVNVSSPIFLHVVDRDIVNSGRHPLQRANRYNMTIAGREFFGESFYFPPGVVTHFIEPYDEHSEYYRMLGWGPPWQIRRYLLVGVEEEAGQEITAVFLPYFMAFFADYDDSMTWRIEFHDKAGSNVRIIPEGQPPFDWDADPHRYLAYVRYLPMSQSELATLTLTFRREERGNLIITSSRYSFG